MCIYTYIDYLRVCICGTCQQVSGYIYRRSIMDFSSQALQSLTIISPSATSNSSAESQNSFEESVFHNCTLNIFQMHFSHLILRETSKMGDQVKTTMTAHELLTTLSANVCPPSRVSTSLTDTLSLPFQRSVSASISKVCF